MKKHLLTVIACIFVSAFVLYILAGATAEKKGSAPGSPESGNPAYSEQTQKGGTAGSPVSDTPVYSVPEVKAEHWEKIRAQLQKEKSVCAEHCGNEKGCLDRCGNVYEHRLDREYKQLMHE